MTSPYPKLSHSAKQGELGVNIVSRVVSEAFEWLFKRNHQEHDFGIDAQIEVVTDDGAVTGQMLAAQIKCGPSFFREKNKWGYVYRGELKHFNYLSNYPIPVLIVICEPDTKQCYWTRFLAENTTATDAGWKITIPFENTLATSKQEILEFLPEQKDSLDELQEYWALNKIIVESGYILFILDNEDVEMSNVARARSFFDRLRATKELANECQGKVEISVSGYDDDPRELFEIEDVRNYIEKLEKTLPELLFFARTEQPTATIRLFAMCLTEVSWEDGRSNELVTRRLTFETDKVGAFLDRQWPGLNEMTEWVGMSLEENKRITYDVVRCLGFNPPNDEDDTSS